jgi:ribonucleotide reductase alpha subunit
MTDNSLVNDVATEAAGETAIQAQADKTFTQEEVNAILARTKTQIEKKFATKYQDLGDPDELRSIKTEYEKRQQEQQIKRGEFEKTLQELAAKKDAEISKRDSIIKEYKVNSPLLSAAAKYRAVNAEQVKSLLNNHVRLNADGEVEVVGEGGAVRYRDDGQPLAVEDLVREFLDSNPHFVSASPTTANTKSNISQGQPAKLDITKLDMKNPEHRKVYAEYRKTAGIA